MRRRSSRSGSSIWRMGAVFLLHLKMTVVFLLDLKIPELLLDVGHGLAPLLAARNTVTPYPAPGFRGGGGIPQVVGLGSRQRRQMGARGNQMAAEEEDCPRHGLALGFPCGGPQMAAEAEEEDIGGGDGRPRRRRRRKTLAAETADGVGDGRWWRRRGTLGKGLRARGDF